MSYTVKAGKPEYRLNVTERVASVLQNIALILSTAQGTVPMYRGFGLPMDALDMSIQAAKARLTVAITEAVREYEPRAEIISVKFDDTGAMTGRLIPVLEVNVTNEEP